MTAGLSLITFIIQFIEVYNIIEKFSNNAHSSIIYIKKILKKKKFLLYKITFS